jgi:hypothetical protein
MNYTQLVAAIESYTENQFPVTYLADGSTVSSAEQINRLIEQTEQRIYNSVQFPSIRKNVIGSITANNKYLACPDDFLAVYSIAVIDALGVYEFLLNKDVNFIRQAYPQPTDTAQPKYYALFGSQSNDPNELTFILGPTPNLTYGVELHYYYYPESIVTAGTTWLGDNFDTALLYGAMREACIFQRQEPDVVQNYEQKYMESMALLKQLGDGKERQDSYRSGQVRYPVK